MIRTISILAPNLSKNNAGRAYLLARVLQKTFDVKLIGPLFQETIWPPIDDGSVPIITVPGGNFPGFFRSFRRLVLEAEADLIVAVKPRLTSLGVGLLARSRYKAPLILDIDDWDVQGNYPNEQESRTLAFARAIYNLPNPYSHFYLRQMERFILRADALTVVSSLLQEKFGGVLVSHGRDTEALDPALFDRVALRANQGWSDHFILMFFGTPRPHKGLADVLTAMQHIDKGHLRFVVVGVDWEDPYVQELQAFGDSRLLLLGMQPWKAVPRFLAMADAVILAQRPVDFSQAQVPAKVFDAMAMAKPIIATAVGDLPAILENCGVIVPPENIDLLREGILSLMDQPDLAAELGRRARQRCLDKYSWHVMHDTLLSLIQELDQNGPAGRKKR